MQIEAKNLGKRFDFQYIVKDISFQIDSGQIFGIKGRNGSGKSTLLKMVSGFLTPSFGEIKYLTKSKEEVKKSDLYKHLSYTAPYIDLPPRLSIEEVLKHYISFKNVYIKDYQEFIQFCDLEDQKDKLIMNFSSGMKQKLALALSLNTQVELLLMDEPTSYLDEYAKSWFYDKLKNFHLDRSILIASNDDADFSFCSDVYEINKTNL
jgi:ABC-type multidrug transport system ATPase subunit